MYKRKNLRFVTEVFYLNVNNSYLMSARIRFFTSAGVVKLLVASRKVCCLIIPYPFANQRSIRTASVVVPKTTEEREVLTLITLLYGWPETVTLTFFSRILPSIFSEILFPCMVPITIELGNAAP